jgi:transcriptional regulator with XRE-family HTH domain
MQEPGRRLRSTRERLKLKYRDVEEASQQIAARRGSDEFVVGLSRLADIENKGTIPSIYRLYSLCAIYRLSFSDVLKWFGVSLRDLVSDASSLSLSTTHEVVAAGEDIGELAIPMDLLTSSDLRQTTFLAQQIRRWGKLPLNLLQSLDAQNYRYGFIGADDWFMYPMLPPGSFVQIDTQLNKVQADGWIHESERPIYFIEHRKGICCGWCTQTDGSLIVQPHPSSQEGAKIFKMPGEAEVLGQVVGLARRLDRVKRRHTHF